MPFQFNPLTGNLDLVGSGGSTSPGGTSGSIQYNNGTTFAGNGNLKWDNSLKIEEVNDGTGNKTWQRGNGAFEAYSNSANSSYFGTSNGLSMLAGINYLGTGTDLGIFNRTDGSHLIKQQGTEYSWANGVMTYDTSVAYLSINDTLRFDVITSPFLVVSDIAAVADFQMGFNVVSGVGTVSFTNSALTKRFSFNGALNISSGGITLPNAGDLAMGTGTGSKIGTATTQKIGFWNKTPIVQPTTAVTAGTFVANTGTAINTASTFDGYTLGKVVTALRNIGLLA